MHFLPQFFSKHKLAIILVVGIAVRLILMPISAHPFDMYVWYNVSQNILKNGPLYLEGFPPMWYHYMMVPVAYAYGGLSTVLPTGTIAMSTLPSALNFYPSYSVTVVPGMLFDFVVKTPFLISDVLVAVLLYKLVGEATASKRLGEAAALLWFLNPFVIWISAGWGMWDTLPALFSLLALYFLIKKRLEFSAASLSIAVALKLYPALFLVPIAIYLWKTSGAGARLRSMGKFLGVFVGASLLLFLPYLGMLSNTVSEFLLLQNVGSAGGVTPLGPYTFGLTYWPAITGLLNPSGNEGFIFVFSAISLGLFAAALTLVYWHTNRQTFQNPVFDLSAVMLLCIVAFFLTYRIVSEQWLIWALPFLAVLLAAGRVRGALYWSVSFIALLFVFLNCPLPFYFLPLSPWLSGTLLGMVHFVWWIDPWRVAGIAVLGIAFSVLLLASVLKLNSKKVFQ